MPESNAVERPRGHLGWRTVLRPLVAASLLALLAVVACGGPEPTQDQPTIASFTADPDQIGPGDSSTLTWSVSGAASLTLFPDGVDVTGRTSWTVEPSVSTTYRLVATNGVGERRASTTVTVGDLPVIESFAAVAAPGRTEFTLVNPGVPVTLAWSVVDADSVTIEGPGLPVRSVGLVDSLEVTPSTVGATYTVRAANGAGPIAASVVVSREVPAFSVLIAGQSNAKGVNVSASEARAFITAAAGVEMLGNDYVWKPAYEPTGDCVGHVDLVSADPDGGCTAFAQNNSGVSPGVSLANRVAAATGGEVFIVPAAKHGSALNGSQANDTWQPGSDPYDRATLFGSAAYRAQRSGIDRDAPLATTVDGAAYGAVLWYQGTSNTTSVAQTDAFFGLTNTVLRAFEQELGAPVIIVQLSSRGDFADRNLLYQRVREVQRRMAEGARTVTGTSASEARAGRYLVVTHDLPMGDVRHLNAVAQRELGRRVSLAVREHLLGETGRLTGPRLVGVVKSSPTVVRVVLDRPVTTSSVTTAAAYSGYFAVFAGGEQVAVSEIRRDPNDTSAVRITLASSVAGDVEVRYMPPVGSPPGIRLDVVRSASCTDPIPGTNACLPLPAFGVATSAETASALRLMVFDDDED